MNLSRISGKKFQIISKAQDEMLQLDLFRFVSDNVLADISSKKRKSRISITKNKVVKSPAGHFYGYIDHTKTFSTFCLGDSNQFAVEAIKRFINTDKTDFGMIYLKASSSLGKTHILHAIANEMLLNKKSFFLSSPLQMLTTIDNVNALKLYSFLLLDDLEEVEGKIELQKILCQLIDYAQAGKIKIILTGTKHPKHLKSCDERFMGKLSAAVTHHISGMNQILFSTIVGAKCREINLIIPQDVNDLVSKQTEYNIRGVESILHKLKSVSEIKNQEVALDMALEIIELKETALKDKIFQHNHYQMFLTIVAEYFYISSDDLLSSVRRRNFSIARHVAIYILKEKIGLGVMRISQLFNKDHSSIIYAVSRIKHEMENDLKMRSKVLQLIENFLSYINK